MPAFPDVHIRPARLFDLVDLNRIKTQAALDMMGDHSLVARRGHARNPKRWFESYGWWQGAHVAEIDGQVAGVVRTRGALFSDLWVGREFRSKGIGAKLARTGEDCIRSDGHRVTYLLTAIFNVRGRAFYERNGWTLARFTQHKVCHFRRCVYVKRL